MKVFSDNCSNLWLEVLCAIDGNFMTLPVTTIVLVEDATEAHKEKHPLTNSVIHCVVNYNTYYKYYCSNDYTSIINALCGGVQ